MRTPIHRVYADKRGWLWIATGGEGVLVYDPVQDRVIQKYATYTRRDKMYGNHVRDILQLNDSLYAFGADGLDLLNIKTGRIKQAGMYHQWPVGPVLTLQADNLGQVWISTSNGIFKYNPESDAYTRFSQWDGLITVHNENFIMEKSLQLRNGQLVFGGNQNLVVFDPAQFRRKEPPPDVTIAGFRLFNDQLPVDSLMSERVVTLGHNQNSLAISFAAISFINIDKLTYFIQLEGADKDWQRVNGPLDVYYTLLPPGHYTFKVRARNEEGIYSKNITSLRIHIRPPFYRTIWFYALVVLAIAGLLYYLYKLRIRRLLQVERIRTRLARDLHDDMGSTLSTINILSNMATKKIATDQASSLDYMSKISDSSSRIMEAMDDIVWSINPVNDSMRKVLARMRELAGNVLEPCDIEYTFTADDTVKEMTFDMEGRREIFLIYKEAINNIVKYSKSTRVQIGLQKQKGFFIMTITDNGIGFLPDTDVSSTRGNGLRNMRKRAENLKGTLEIASAMDAGTSIELRIPLA